MNKATLAVGRAVRVGAAAAFVAATSMSVAAAQDNAKQFTFDVPVDIDLSGITEYASLGAVDFGAQCVVFNAQDDIIGQGESAQAVTLPEDGKLNQTLTVSFDAANPLRASEADTYRCALMMCMNAMFGYNCGVLTEDQYGSVTNLFQGVDMTVETDTGRQQFPLAVSVDNIGENIGEALRGMQNGQGFQLPSNFGN